MVHVLGYNPYLGTWYIRGQIQGQGDKQIDMNWWAERTRLALELQVKGCAVDQGQRSSAYQLVTYNSIKMYISLQR